MTENSIGLKTREYKIEVVPGAALKYVAGAGIREKLGCFICNIGLRILKRPQHTLIFEGSSFVESDGTPSIVLSRPAFDDIVRGIMFGDWNNMQP